MGPPRLFWGGSTSACPPFGAPRANPWPARRPLRRSAASIGRAIRSDPPPSEIRFPSYSPPRPRASEKAPSENAWCFLPLRSVLSYRAFDFCAAALTDVNHLNQAIGEFDRLACFRFHRFIFFCCHPAPTARTDHNWLFWARPHASEINTIKQTCQSGEIGPYQKARNWDTTHSLNSNRHRPFQNRTHGYALGGQRPYLDLFGDNMQPCFKARFLIPA